MYESHHFAKFAFLRPKSEASSPSPAPINKNLNQRPNCRSIYVAKASLLPYFHKKMAKPEECGHCQKPATIHLTQIVDGQVSKVDLCADCPFKSSVADPEGFSLADFLLKPSGETDASSSTSPASKARCQTCGFTPADFKKQGRFGCPDCYESFKGMLAPMLSNMHKGISHQGRVPERALQRLQREERITGLQEALRDAIRKEDYESAAKLRDELNQLRTPPKEVSA